MGLLDLLSQKDTPFVERLPDILLGLSLIGWAFAGTISDWGEKEAVFPVRISLAVLQAYVGVLILLRKPATEQGHIRALLLSLPSFLFSGLLFRLAEPLAEWPEISKWAFAVAVVWVILCFWSLKKSFSILPARRAVVRSGPYRLLRHPAYAGEIIMGAACAWASGSIWGLICFVALVPFVVIRIQQEELLMANDPAYLEYQRSTKWRLIPWIW